MSTELPASALAEYLQTQVEGFHGPLTATRFKGGQSNPTYLIEAASGKYVLRRKPAGKLLASAHAVDREYAVLRALSGSPVPVAAPLHLCTDDSIIGSWFYLMAHVPGPIHWNPALPDLPGEERAAVHDALLQTMAALHQVDVDAVGLGDYGKPGNYFQRQVGRWSQQYRAAETTTIPAMETLIEWLPAQAPDEDGSRVLVHGDFRIDNFIFSADNQRVAAVVDWELSTLGHPLADLSYYCMCLRLPANPLLPGLGGLDRAALGIPDEHAMIARYTALTGTPVGDTWSFCLAFNFFRLAAIAQGVYRRSQQGNASSEQAHKAGQMVAMLAQMGVEVR